ncbi:MAG TPA: HEAT repeat domain-containing protein [Bryobacteraceae bacterium]|nr:HEAT repeat domain-containing protein [Bryobacteraceae bacterium]
MKTLFAAALSAACLFGQQPQVENAKLETKALAGSLQTVLTQHGAGPFWAAWAEPMIPGRHGDMCWSNGNNDDGHATGAPVRLEGQTTLLVLVRVENAQVDQLRVASMDCRFDGGGLPFYWLTGVPAAESIAWLKMQVTEKNPDRAVLAIALHSGAAAEAALDELVSVNQPARVREKTAFWLGNSRGAHGLDVLKRMLASDPDIRVREQGIFAISQSREPTALATLIDEAKNDKTAQVRSKALFWLAQKAANKQAVDTIGSAVVNDPERSVKEQAVFALKQLPESQGIPMLINVAKNNPDPAVRKKAMFWLGQSKDPRAIDYFAQVLK